MPESGLHYISRHKNAAVLFKTVCRCAFLFARAPRLHFAFAHNTRDKKLIPFQRRKPVGNLHTTQIDSAVTVQNPFFALAKVYAVYSNVQQCMQKNALSWEQQPLSGFSLGRLNESQRGGGIQKGCAACAPLFNFIWISRGYCPRHTAFIYMHRAVLAPSSSCAISAHSRTRRNEKKRTH